MNFILRSIIIHECKTKSENEHHDERIETNQIIGDSYNFVGKFESPEEFEKICNHDNFGDYKDDVFGFISCQMGSNIIPLFSKREWYVMTESGRTFSRLR